jgi:hypothetical protein
MSKRGVRAYNLVRAPAAELAKFNCLDCGINVITIGDWYMAEHHIWDEQGLGWKDNLCLACLEARLGRPLRPGLGVDVSPASTCFVGQPRLSKRLLELWPIKKRVNKSRRAARQVAGVRRKLGVK